MKIIRIEKCAGCFHKSSQLGTAAPYCKLHPMSLAIADTGTVPEWCPLEEDVTADLLAALVMVEQYLVEREIEHRGTTGRTIVLPNIRDAIAKARGKSPDSGDLG